MNKLEVLYEDNHLIVVVKPSNVLSQQDATGDISLQSMVKDYLKEVHNKPGNVYLALLHRLDRPVGGVMVFAKTSKAASRMSEMFQRHDITKKYLAVVHGILKEKEAIFEDYLRKMEDGNTEVTTKEKGKYSKLSYRVLEENKEKKLSLVEVVLFTGRHHQIRVQFSSRDYPLYGDQRYGKQDRKQIALWAYELEIIHPVTKEKMKFLSFPNPEIEPWNCFHMQFLK